MEKKLAYFVEDDGLAGRIFIPFETENEARAYQAQRYPACCPMLTQTTYIFTNQKTFLLDYEGNLTELGEVK